MLLLELRSGPGECGGVMAAKVGTGAMIMGSRPMGGGLRPSGQVCMSFMSSKCLKFGIMSYVTSPRGAMTIGVTR